MTEEGIIQSIFKKAIEKHRANNDDPYFGELYEQRARELEQLQADIIAEIKRQLVDPTNDYPYMYTIRDVLRQLIGERRA